MKKVLITGANSYIGTSFEKYIKENHPDDYQIDTLDMLDQNWKEYDFSGYDSVFHVAGIAHKKESKKNAHLYYEINRDHPIIKQLILQNRNLEKPLYSLFQQIERGLPLNQLYIDLNNDEKLQNEQSQEEEDIMSSLYSILELIDSVNEKITFLESLSVIEPFSAYPQAIETMKKELLK